MGALLKYFVGGRGQAMRAEPPLLGRVAGVGFFRFFAFSTSGVDEASPHRNFSRARGSTVSTQLLLCRRRGRRMSEEISRCQSAPRKGSLTPRIRRGGEEGAGGRGRAIHRPRLRGEATGKSHQENKLGTSTMHNKIIKAMNLDYLARPGAEDHQLRARKGRCEKNACLTSSEHNTSKTSS